MMQEQINFRILHHEDIAITMEAGVSLFFGLHGQYTIATAHESCAIHASEVYAVSPFTLYRVLGGEDAGLLQITLSPEILQRAGWQEKQQISCYLTRDSLKDALAQEVRRRCAAVFRLYFQQTNQPELMRQAVELAALLRREFAAVEAARPEESINALKLLESALQTIHTRWKQAVTLPEVAAQLYVSESYLSRLFKKYLGKTFTKYLVELRLTHAAADLQSGLSVTETAYRNGFKSDNSFIDFFKKAYGCTPGKFRQQAKESGEKSAAPQEDVADWLQELLQYSDGAPLPAGDAPVLVRKSVQLAEQAACTPIRPSWRKMVNIGYAHDGLIGSVQTQLRRAQEEIGFTYLRFHGILDDDMHIYQEHADGSPWFNFAYADLLFDFIQEIGLIPYVELSYIPSKLAKGDATLFDNRNIHITMYNDPEKWQALIQACLSHWIDKYGLNAVRRWKFTVFSMNYTEMTDPPLTREEHSEMFAAVYHTLKTIDPELQLGGGGCFPSIALEENGLPRFLREMRRRGCMPDFITLQCYPHEQILQDMDFLYFTSNQVSAPSVLSKDRDFTRHFLDKIHRMLEQIGCGEVPVVVEEWNSTLWQRDLSSDTCYKAAWLVKNALQSYDRTETLGYWLLTDFIDEWLIPGGVFHGGYGLFTMGGIPKAGYRALRLLSRVGAYKVADGDGWFVSRTENEIQVFLYHYCHYDALYRYRYQKLTDPHDAYKVFENSRSLKIKLSLCGLDAGVYRQESWTISRTSGSTFDKWLEMGTPGVMAPDDLRYLNNSAQPLCTIRDTDTVGTLQIEAELQPHEVRMIVLRKRDA